MEKHPPEDHLRCDEASKGHPHALGPFIDHAQSSHDNHGARIIGPCPKGTAFDFAPTSQTSVTVNEMLQAIREKASREEGA